VNGPCGTGSGRIRIDAVDRAQINFNYNGVPPSVGRYLKVFPDVLPKLHIVKVAFKDAAGADQAQVIPEGAPGPVDIALPFNAPPHLKVSIQLRGLSGMVPIDLVTTPENGDRVDHLVTIDASAPGPAAIDVDIAVNTRTHLMAFTK
jgi:hypothetical protein